MLTPSQIAEMAAVKYPFVTDEDKGREQYFNKHITAQQSAYIAAFTDAMELMSKEWASVSERMPNEGDIVLCFGVGTRASISIFSYGEFIRYVDTIPSDRLITIYYDKVTHWMPLPEPPVLTKDKKI